MAFSRPKWAMDYIKELEGGKSKDQITIVPGLIGGAKDLTYTGSGADGKIQADMPVMEDKAQYHEGEVVIPKKDVDGMGGPNSAMSRIQRMMKHRSEAPSVSGYACGKPKMKGYQTGGAVSASNPYQQGSEQYDYWNMKNKPAPSVAPTSGDPAPLSPENALGDTQPIQAAPATNPYQQGSEQYDYWNLKNKPAPSVAPTTQSGDPAPLSPENALGDTQTVTVLNADGTTRSASDAANLPGQAAATNAATPEATQSVGQTIQNAAPPVTKNPYQPGTEQYDYWNKQNAAASPEGGDTQTVQVLNEDGTVRTPDQAAALPAEAAAINAATPETRYSVGQAIDNAKAPAVTPTAPTTTPAATISTGNPTYDRAANSMLQQMTQIANGTSDMVRRQYAMAFNALDARLQTALVSTAMRISNDPNMTSGAKVAMMAEQMRNAGIAQSEMAAGVAKEMISNAMNATSSAYNMANSERLNQQALEERDYSRKMELKSGAINAAVAAKDWAAVAKLSKDLYGVDLDVSKLKSQDSLGIIADANNFILTNAITPLGASATIETPGVRSALTSIWNEMNPGQPMDENWAREQLGKMIQATDPVWQFNNAIDENDALIYFNGDPAKLAAFKFGNKTGLEAFKSAMYAFQAGGAVALDANGQFTFNEESPVWKLVQDAFGMGETGTTGTTGTGTTASGTTGTAAKPKEGDTKTNQGSTFTYTNGQWVATTTPANLSQETRVTPSGNKEGDTKSAGGQTFKFTNGQWVAQTGAMANDTIPFTKDSVFGDDMKVTDYDNWKKSLGASNEWNLNDAGMNLEEFARAGNETAIKDYAAMLASDPAALDYEYDGLSDAGLQAVKDAIPPEAIGKMVQSVYLDPKGSMYGQDVPPAYASILVNSEPTNPKYVELYAKTQGYTPMTYSKGVASNWQSLYDSDYSAAQATMNEWIGPIIKRNDPNEIASVQDASSVFSDSGNGQSGINLDTTKIASLSDAALAFVPTIGSFMHLKTGETNAMNAAIAAEQKRRADLKKSISESLSPEAAAALTKYVFPTA
jgi:hypothetical protein